MAKEKHEVSHAEQKPKKGLKVFLFILIAIFIISLIVFALIVIQVPYTVNVDDTSREAYSDTQCTPIVLKSLANIEKNIPVDCVNKICDQKQSVCTNTNWYGSCTQYTDQCIHEACTKYRAQCAVVVKNIDDTEGTWSVNKYTKADNSGNQWVGVEQVYVRPTETGVVRWDFTYDAGFNADCNYEMGNAPTKSKCDNVISYRNVPTTKTEIRYCNVWKKIAGEC